MSDTIKTITGFLIILVALPLSILWLRDPIKRARTMGYSKAQTVERAAAYILGVSLIGLGILGFQTNPEQGQTSADPVVDYVFGVDFIIIGTLIWAATRFRYGGGLWFAVGMFLVGGALAGIVTLVEAHMRDSRYESTEYLSRITTFWVVGFILLFIGHWRHCRKKRIWPGTIQAGPTQG